MLVKPVDPNIEPEMGNQTGREEVKTHHICTAALWGRSSSQTGNLETQVENIDEFDGPHQPPQATPQSPP